MMLIETRRWDLALEGFHALLRYVVNYLLLFAPRRLNFVNEVDGRSSAIHETHFEAPKQNRLHRRNHRLPSLFDIL